MANGFDLVGILLIVVMTFSGLKKGLIDGVVKILGMCVAFNVSMNFHEHGTTFLLPLIDLPASYQMPAGFVLVFLGTMIAINLAALILKKMVNTMRLGVVDKVGGLTFGALKAGLILSVAVWVTAMVPRLGGDWQRESKLYPYTEIFADQMAKVLSLEDKLALMEGLNDPDVDKIALIQSAMGGEGGLLGGGMDGLMGDDSSQGEAIQKAMESMGGAQKGLMEQVLKSAGVEGLGGEEGLDIMKHLDKAQTAGADRQKAMEAMLKEIEEDAQGSKK